MSIYNLTPHPIVIFAADGTTRLQEIPSHGELRLAAKPGSLDTRIPELLCGGTSKTKPWTGGVVDPAHVMYEGVQIPVRGGQIFVGLDKASPGYAILANASFGDRVIVSMPVKDYIIGTGGTGGPSLYTPGMGPGDAVRDSSGRPLGTKSLEYHPYVHWGDRV